MTPEKLVRSPQGNSYKKLPIRKAHIQISVLRSFYTKLFHLIKDEDLKDDDGEWFRAANDVAMFSPIIEMGRNRARYVPEITYFYNSNTGLNNKQTKTKEQRKNGDLIRSRPAY